MVIQLCGVCFFYPRSLVASTNKFRNYLKSVYHNTLHQLLYIENMYSIFRVHFWLLLVNNFNSVKSKIILTFFSHLNWVFFFFYKCPRTTEATRCFSVTFNLIWRFGRSRKCGSVGRRRKRERNVSQTRWGVKWDRAKSCAHKKSNDNGGTLSLQRQRQRWKGVSPRGNFPSKGICPNTNSVYTCIVCIHAIPGVLWINNVGH